MAPNSPVQDFALEILSMLDVTERERSRRDMVKRLLVSNEEDMVRSQFPEYFLSTIEEAFDDQGNFDIDKVDDSQVEWSTASPDEDDEIGRWIADREAGMYVTAADEEWK